IDPFRYVYGGEQERLIFQDAIIDDTAATSILPGHEEPTAGHPPAWTVTLAFFSLLGFDSVTEHQLIGAAVGTVGVVLVGLAAREVARGVHPGPFDDVRARRADAIALVAAGIAAVYPFLWINDALVM